MRVLVTGGNGSVAGSLLACAAHEAGMWVATTSRSSPRGAAEAYPSWEADLAEPRDVRRVFADARPNLVFHTAALGDLDRCEREPERASRDNVVATRLVARACAEWAARLVHLSTDAVFDGAAPSYGEDDPPCPLGVYGRTKWESERVALDGAPGAVVARTTVVFGALAGPHTRADFVVGLLARLRRGERVGVAADQVRAPTYAPNLAEMLWALGRDGRPDAAGVFHTVGATAIDRCALARLVATTFGLNPDLIEPVTSASRADPAPRPLRAVLRMDKFRARYPAVPVVPVGEALERLKERMGGD